jgi:diguanylate cyclase (GGDEF)-like protein
MFSQQIVVVSKKNADVTLYSKALKYFKHKKICYSAVEALQLLEENPAFVVIVDAELDDMRGVELAEAIRDIDSERSHFTYTVLLEGTCSEEIQLGLATHVDAWCPAGDKIMIRQITLAGARLSKQINEISAQNDMLKSQCDVLQRGQLLDPLTGLGNRKYAEQILKDSIRQIESRGGAVCFLMIAIDNYQELLNKRDQRIADQLVIAVSERIQQLVRPMDIVTYFDEGQFALVLLQPTIENCSAECYQRIYDGVRLKSFKTALGFQTAKIAMSICASEAQTGPPQMNTLIDTAMSNLNQASISDEIIVSHLYV